MSSVACSSIPASSGWKVLDRVARGAALKQFAHLKRGQMTLADGVGTTTLGDPSDLHATLRVHHPRFFRQAVLGGTLSVAESYFQGDWDCDDLTSLFRIFVRNRGHADRLDSGLAWMAGLAHRLYHWQRSNTRSGSRGNIGAHYDLGNDFFRLWLDDTWAYSSGMFLTPAATLREASLEKFDRVCRKLQLQPSQEVLEIGGGWGGFALHAAANYGCRVTTTTISQRQFEVGQQRIAEAGLTERISLLKSDYRDLRGQFGALVAIEMIEAVGHRYLDAFFQQCSALLRPDGSLVLQAIVMPERHHAQYLRGVDFIQRYVFPGGCLPSVSSILESVGRASDLRLVHAEDFAPHYAQTLRCWRRAFLSQREEARRLGYTEEFLRLWDYYLCYCEAVFEERYVGVVQLQFDKPLCRRDPLHVTAQAAARTSRN